MELNGHSVAVGGLLLCLVDFLLVGGLLIRPLFLEGGDDHGDGINQVLLPPPNRTAPFRRFSFFIGLFAVLSFLYSGLLLTVVDHLYGQIVGGLAALIVRDPGAVTAVVSHASLGTRFLYAALFICFAATVQGGAGRRVLVAAHALWYLAALSCIDSFLVAADVLTGTGITPFGLLGNVVGSIVGIVVFFRFLFTSFQLPRRTAIPIRGDHRRFAESTALVLVVAGALALTLLLVAVLRQGAVNQGALPVVLSLYLPGAAVALVYLGLAILLAFRDPAPVPAAVRPPIDVITPAYNEEERLPCHLAAIDDAARRYGGAVHVVVCDDGSGDRTIAVAEESIRAMTAATGEVLAIPHAGKAGALNAAFNSGRRELVIRVDADVEVGEDAFVHTCRWFQDPSVGMVGALNLPAKGSTWLHRMRELECLWGFGFGRRALQAVDAVVCVPGTYAAFRRDIATQLGGFVDGMNGEDTDLTISFGRVGYAVVLDTEIRVYEDVPPTLLEFREQRIRWNRAGMHVFARHAFFRAGFCGPRTWFSLTRLQAWRVVGCVHLLLAVHIAMLALLAPGYRTALLLALAIPLAATVVMVPILIALCLFYRRYRPLPFVLGWWAFLQLRRVFMVESIFTLPGRPVVPVRWAASPLLGDRQRVAATGWKDLVAVPVAHVPEGAALELAGQGAFRDRSEVGHNGHNEVVGDGHNVGLT